VTCQGGELARKLTFLIQISLFHACCSSTLHPRSCILGSTIDTDRGARVEGAVHARE
jgi:hypothetical protein